MEAWALSSITQQNDSFREPALFLSSAAKSVLLGFDLILGIFFLRPRERKGESKAFRIDSYRGRSSLSPRWGVSQPIAIGNDLYTRSFDCKVEGPVRCWFESSSWRKAAHEYVRGGVFLLFTPVHEGILRSPLSSFLNHFIAYQLSHICSAVNRNKSFLERDSWARGELLFLFFYLLRYFVERCLLLLWRVQQRAREFSFFFFQAQARKQLWVAFRRIQKERKRWDRDLGNWAHPIGVLKQSLEWGRKGQWNPSCEQES